MAQWNKNDASSNSVSWAVAGFKKPANTSNIDAFYGNTTANAFVNGIKVGQFGVATNEMSSPGTVGTLYAVNILTPGAGYTAVPTWNTSGGGGSNANGTFNMRLVSITVGHGGNNYAPGDTLRVNGGTASVNAIVNVVTTEVRSATVSEGGTGYANGDVFTVTTGTGTSANGTVTTGAANTSVASVTFANLGIYTVNPTVANVATTNTTGTGTGLRLNIVTKIRSVGISNSGIYTALPTLANNQVVTLTGTGVSANINLSFGINAAQVSNVGTSYTSAPTIVGSVGGTSNATFQGVIYDNNSAKANKGITHSGWVVRTEGTGGRAGRVHYETLVASRSITSDGADDAVLPE